MFNFTDITFILMDAGANVEAKNLQGETTRDLGPIFNEQAE